MTAKEYEELKLAVSRVDLTIPIKKYPDDAYSDDQIRELYRSMSGAVTQNPAVLDDSMWADGWDAIQRIAGYRGIC